MQNLKSLLLNGRILLVLLVLVLFAGCSDDDEGSSTQPGTLDRLFSYPTITACGTCHIGGKTGLDLTTPVIFRNELVNKYSRASAAWSDLQDGAGRSIGDSEACGTKHLLIDTSAKNASNSVLLNSISNKYPIVGCTSSVGFHQTQRLAVSQALLDDLILWIERGAPAN